MKKHYTIAIIFFAALLTGNPSFAQEKKSLDAQGTGVFTTLHRIEADDVEGHTFSVYEARGAGKGTDGGFTFYNKGISNLVKGEGSHQGTIKIVDQDGDVRFNQWQGKVSPIKTQSGKNTMSFEGTWNIVGGTGKWDKSEGSGTYKGMFIGDGIYTINMVGEYKMMNK